MEHRNYSDIAAFPELFDGLEQFIEEQAKGFKRTSALLVLGVGLPGALLGLYVLSRVA